MSSNIGAEFQYALRQVLSVSRRTEPEIVNKALKDVGFRAASFTPKSTPAEVTAELTSNRLLPKLASASCNKKYGVRNWTRAQHQQECRLILRNRKGGLGAIRAGWIPAIRRFGGTYRGARLNAGGSAAQGNARLATIENAMGWIENAAVTKSANGSIKGAGQIPQAVRALERAVAFVAADRRQHAERQMAARLTRFR